MDVNVRDRVGLLCDQLSRWPSLMATIQDGGAQAELDTLLALVASETDPDSKRVSDLIDLIESACARQGVVGLTSRDGVPGGGITSLPPGMASTPEVMGWTCPLGRCDRVVTSDETSNPPTCVAAHGPNTYMKPYPAAAL